MTADTDRIDQLARRVRWLDRYRRHVAIPIALAATAWAVLAFDAALQTNAGLLAFPLLALLAWWVLETALAGVATYWEVSHDRLCDAHGLPRAELPRVPRAELLPRKRKRAAP